ncbi:MAG: sensor histidine kinase, partial [Arcobacter sp.]|nr:sensor histidine kinase [Arcobacter sp.]
MFNKEGIPFFIIVIPFLSILFVSFLSISYYLKLSNETYQTEINEYKRLHLEKLSDTQIINTFLEIKIKEHEEEEKKFKRFLLTATAVILVFMILFTFLMLSIIKDVIKKYKLQVQNRESALESLNENLSLKVKQGIEEAKQKDRKILEQAKLARIGSMISMIAHQWRQPLSQLSGILMELETTTRFKKVDNDYILNAIDKSDKMIEFMSNTIDDF